MASTEERVLLRQELVERTVLQRTAQRQGRAVAGRAVPLAAYLAFASICLLWGTTFLGIRIAIETIPTLLVTSIRFVGAGLILLAISLARGVEFPSGRRQWIDQMINGVVMVSVANTALVWAEHHITSGLAALLAATIPIWMALLESSFGMARLTVRKIAGLALALAGVAYLVAPDIGSPDTSMKFFLAIGAVQLSAIAWNLGTLRSKRHPTRGGPTSIAAIQMLSGGVAVALVAFVSGAHVDASFSTRSVWAVAYLMIFGSVIAYSAYLYALSKISAGKLSLYAYVNPAIAVVVGALVLSEPLTLRMLIAMLVILSGVAVVQLEKRLS